MRVGKLGILWKLWAVAMVFSLAASGPVSANEEDWGGRAPKAEATAKKKAVAKTAKAKAKAKAKTAAVKKKARSVAKKPTAKAKARTKSKAVKKMAKARRSSAPKSHYPVQPQAGAEEHPAGLPDVSNEQKDDLPPPQNTEPEEE